MSIEITKFRNKPILKLTEDNSYTKLYIGIKKAKLIKTFYNDIIKFIEDIENNIIK